MGGIETFAAGSIETMCSMLSEKLLSNVLSFALPYFSSESFLASSILQSSERYGMNSNVWHSPNLFNAFRAAFLLLTSMMSSMPFTALSSSEKSRP
nr:hypothetical protein [uncultured archaeon]